MEINIDEIVLAYKKLKSYAYYDNSSVVLRKQIIEFESKDIEKKFEEIVEKVNKNQIEDYLKNIDVICLPKKIKKHENSISNVPSEIIEVNSTINIIDTSIMLHILGVLWVIKTWEFFEKNISDDVYSNRIRSVENNTISLFKPYYQNYSKWRDKGISSIENRLKENKNVVYISMDIKDYFYSINMNSKKRGFISLKEQLKNYYSSDSSIIIDLTNMIESICSEYSKKVIDNERCILPIGFLPSLVLSNWYLKDFDKAIVDSVNPIYYGRYVDDIILVCNIYDTDKNSEEIIKKYLIETNILKNSKDDKAENKLEVECSEYQDLVLQPNKIDVKIWNYKYTAADIDIFKKDIERNRSEFRILPENIEECIGDIYKINYKDSKNKIRSLSTPEVDKLELSKTISKVIFKRKQDICKGDCSSYFDKEIKHIFIYENAIDNFRLWEKIIYYLNQSNNLELLRDLITNLYNSIDKIKVNIDKDNQNYKLKLKDEEVEKRVKEYLIDNILIAISMSRAVNSKFNEGLFVKYFNKDKVNEYTDKIIQSNMMRHNYVATPLVNYGLIKASENKFTSFNIDILKEMMLDKRKLKYSPRFIHLHEFILFNYYKNLTNNYNGCSDKYLDTSKEQFIKYNYNNESKSNLSNKYFKLESKPLSIDSLDGNSRKYNINKIEAITEDDNKDVVKIAIANIQIYDEIIEEIIKGNKSRAYKNLNLFKRILNEASKNEVDFIVLPEVSIPIEWINFMGEFSRKHNIAIICGLQHFRIKGSNYIYNNLVTILPIKQGDYISSLIKFRLKNHYAPFEKEIINRYSFEIPKCNLEYDLFKWRGVQFACYNCFELASIEERAIMKGYVDIMFASVLNKDIKYFSNIIDSVTRDLHCYFVQVNTSQYGDNRITQPAKSNYKDILRIKGGRNSFIVIGEVNINNLREFQIMDHRAQMNIKNKFFKPTPPNFRINTARNKLKLDEIIYEDRN